MAWIESHQTLLNHPKTRRAARLLGIQRVHLVGHLHALWWWAMDYAPDGDLTGLDAADIADAMEWDGDGTALLDALVSCGRPTDGAGTSKTAGFLEQTNDGRLLIHDWDDYAGKLIVRRRRDAERKRAERQAPDEEPRPQAKTDDAETLAQDVRRTSDGRRAPSVVTVPNLTVPTPHGDARARTREGPAPSEPWAVVEDVFEVAGADAASLGRAERGRQSKAALTLLADHDRAAIRACAGWLWSQEFWRSRGIDVMTVRDQLPRWIAAGQPEAFTSARASPGEPLLLGAAYREFDPSEVP